MAMTIRDIRPPEDVPALVEHVAGLASGPAGQLYGPGRWKRSGA